MQGKSTALNIYEADAQGVSAFTAVGFLHEAIPASVSRRSVGVPSISSGAVKATQTGKNCRPASRPIPTEPALKGGH